MPADDTDSNRPRTTPLLRWRKKVDLGREQLRVLGGILLTDDLCYLVSIIMLYVRGNNDTDDAEYYVNHLMFAAFR